MIKLTIGEIRGITNIYISPGYLFEYIHGVQQVFEHRKGPEPDLNNNAKDLILIK
jgi:hypothetical protein